MTFLITYLLNYIFTIKVFYTFIYLRLYKLVNFARVGTTSPLCRLVHSCLVHKSREVTYELLLSLHGSTSTTFSLPFLNGISVSLRNFIRKHNVTKDCHCKHYFFRNFFFIYKLNKYVTTFMNMHFIMIMLLNHTFTQQNISYIDQTNPLTYRVLHYLC